MVPSLFIYPTISKKAPATQLGESLGYLLDNPGRRVQENSAGILVSWSNGLGLSNSDRTPPAAHPSDFHPIAQTDYFKFT
jgi:hypothetical protein